MAKIGRPSNESRIDVSLQSEWEECRRPSQFGQTETKMIRGSELSKDVLKLMSTPLDGQMRVLDSASMGVLLRYYAQMSPFLISAVVDPSFSAKYQAGDKGVMAYDHVDFINCGCQKRRCICFHKVLIPVYLERSEQRDGKWVSFLF
jgi:hypothetical protein